MPGQTGGVTMAPLFAQRDRQMATGFPLAITGRKEEINSKCKHVLSLPECTLTTLQSSTIRSTSLQATAKLDV